MVVYDPIPGIHHVTAIAGPPQRNVDFYVGVLGLRLVKRTVNFDDPGTYHLYYGDEQGSPGSILTFFPWPSAVRGRSGAGMADGVTFSISEDSIDYWRIRLAGSGGNVEETMRFGMSVLRARDPDGMLIEMAAHMSAGAQAGWEEGTVPPEHALCGFFGATIAVTNQEHTARLLTDVFDYQTVGEEGRRLRFKAPGGAPGNVVDVVHSDEVGRAGAGTVHHVAFRARTDEQQQQWRERIARSGLYVTDVKDRNYFRSIYFREPGGVLFEIATDAPGFTVDESLEKLGSDLKLPSWLEPRRSDLEEQLGTLRLPGSAPAEGPL